MSQSTQPTELRIAIARHVVERKRQELGEHLVAACCYGSVAHHAAAEYSDVEMIVVTDESVEARDEYFFEQGIMVECSTRPGARLLAAARRITSDWGIEADQYRNHLVLWDPGQFFARLAKMADSAPEEDFAKALQQCWWECYEVRNKLRNAVLIDDSARICRHGWGFAFRVAMFVALHERRYYESERTIWRDIVARGYGMPELLKALTTGDLRQIPSAVDNVWERIHTLSGPGEEY